jgi:predicted PurR-regulated permease PerM
LYWCYGIIKPFIDIVIWTGIFAIALFPAYNWLLGKTGNRKGLSIIILLLITVILLAIPGLLFAQSLFDGISFIKTRFETSDRIIPWDIEAVKGWPYVGTFLFEKLKWISEHIGEAIRQYSPQIQKVVVSIISSAASAGLAFFKFIISIAIAGFLLINSGKASEIANRVFLKILGETGEEFADTAVNTVRTVLRGILGIAFIQSFLFGIGMIVVGVPAAGLWFILSLVFGIIQVGIFPVSIPVIIYVFAVKSTGTAIPFLIWSLLVSVVDNILRPVLLGRGSGVPMAVVFVGAIGGLLHSGVAGLFTGTVVFAVAYRLFIFWIDDSAAGGSDSSTVEQADPKAEKQTRSVKD